MANDTKRPEYEQNNTQVREVKTKLVRDYIENQRNYASSQRQQGAGMNVLQGDQLVFTVLDDIKLYGSEALDKEVRTRQYDPYTVYKQSLNNAQVAQSRTLQITVSESA